ncbi:MAG TPA: PH domain-containing protein [Longimicrobiales bacterium]|nr:PH domain-containing protein [Longimicrobiales bacterium]
MTDTFPIVPAHSRAIWVLVVLVLAVLIATAAVMIKTARGSRHSTFELSGEGLRLRGDLYGRMIPAAALRGGSARLVDLRIEPGLVPRSRRFGTAVGDYRSGWFRLRNGEKALLYLTDQTRSVYVPTTAGYSVLLTPQNAELFVGRLRTIAPQP